MDSSAGGQSAAAAAELVNLRMAALTAKNQVLEEQLKNVQLQAQIVENGVIVDVLKEKNKTLEGQLKNGELREKELEKAQKLNNVQLQAQIAENGAKFAVLEEKNKTLECQLKNAVAECEKALEKVRELQNVQLQAHISGNGANLEVQKEKNKMLESQLEKVELREKALEKKLEEKYKQVAQFTASLATLGKQLATLSGNSNKILVHLPLDDNNWNLAASSPIFTMNTVGSASVPSAGMGGGGSEANEVKWYHAFALKGFPVLDAIMKKGQHNNVTSNKTAVFYYEVRIVEPEEHYHAVGLSMGYNKDFDDHVGQHANSYGFDEFGQAYYVCGKIHHTRDNLPKALVNGFDDIYGFGLLVKPNKELAIFATINGVLIGQQVPIQFWSEFLYPTVSVSKLTMVEANFGIEPFRYDIDNCPGLQL